MLGLGTGLTMPLRRSGGPTRLFVPAASRWMVEGDSIAAQIDGRSMAAWAAALSSGRITFLPNATPGTEGTGGDTLEDVRLDVAAVLAEFPTLSHVIIHAGRNSLTDGIASMKDKAEDIIDAYNAGNVHVIWSCVLKSTDTVGLNATHEATRTAFNQWLAGLSGKNLTVVNHDAVFSPATMPDMVQSDGVHPTPAGERVIVSNILASLSFEAENHIALMPSANVVTNAAFAGATSFTTGFTADSVVPTNWTLTNATGATVKASVLDIAGVRVVEFLGSGSATNATSDLRLARPTANELPLSVDQWIEGGMFVDIANSAGTGDAVGVKGWAVATGDAVAFRKDHNATSYGRMDGRFTAFVRVPPVKETAASAFQSFGFYCQLAAGPVDFRIRLWSPYGCIAG